MMRSGRTTRMLQAAIEAAQSGGYVFVVAKDMRHATRLFEQAREIGEFGEAINPGNGTLKLVNPGTVTFHAADDPAFDGMALRFRGAHGSCETLIDHAVIESHFSRHLEALHRFDQ